MAHTKGFASHVSSLAMTMASRSQALAASLSVHSQDRNISPHQSRIFWASTKTRDFLDCEWNCVKLMMVSHEEWECCGSQCLMEEVGIASCSALLYHHKSDLQDWSSGSVLTLISGLMELIMFLPPRHLLHISPASPEAHLTFITL